MHTISTPKNKTRPPFPTPAKPKETLWLKSSQRAILEATKGGYEMQTPWVK